MYVCMHDINVFPFPLLYFYFLIIYPWAIFTRLVLTVIMHVLWPYVVVHITSDRPTLFVTKQQNVKM